MTRRPVIVIHYGDLVANTTQNIRKVLTWFCMNFDKITYMKKLYKKKRVRLIVCSELQFTYQLNTARGIVPNCCIYVMHHEKDYFEELVSSLRIFYLSLDHQSDNTQQYYTNKKTAVGKELFT